jgi:hypothetical protein
MSLKITSRSNRTQWLIALPIGISGLALSAWIGHFQGIPLLYGLYKILLAERPLSLTLDTELCTARLPFRRRKYHFVNVRKVELIESRLKRISAIQIYCWSGSTLRMDIADEEQIARLQDWLDAHQISWNYSC